MPMVAVLVAQHVSVDHVNAQFNKIPQLAMELQHERDGGMIPQGIGWGVSQTPWANKVRPYVNGETHGTPTTFCPLSSIINFFQKLDEAVNALGKARHGSLMAWLRKLAILQVCSLGGHVIAFATSKPAGKCVPIPSSPGSRWTLGEFVHSHCWSIWMEGFVFSVRGCSLFYHSFTLGYFFFL